MSRYRYSVNTDKPELVKAVGRSLAISRKQSIEVCSLIRKKRLETAKQILERVIEKKQAVPYKRFTGDTGHKKNTGPARYPIKTCREILTLLERVEAGAIQRGLDSHALIITHISAQSGAKQMHYGRKRRRRMKRAHIEVVAEEKKELKQEGKTKKRETAEKSDGGKKPVVAQRKTESQGQEIKDTTKKQELSEKKQKEQQKTAK